MELHEFLKPLDVKKDLLKLHLTTDSWLHSIDIYKKNFPSLDDKKIAILGVITDNFKEEANLVRSFLYSYTKKKYTDIIVDIGNN